MGACWDDAAAFWRRHDAMEARLTRQVSERLCDLARLAPGMRVLDVACGRGEPALSAARRVGPSGFVLGVDLSEEMLRIARERAAAEGVTNLELRNADAEALDLGGERFDAATLRWGLMYMRDRARALRGIHAALRPGGRLALASWVEPARVPYASIPRTALARYGALPPQAEGEPGTFRDADQGALEAALTAAGFAIEASEELDIPVVEADDASGIMTWLRGMRSLTTLVDAMPEHDQAAWERDVVAEVETYRRGGKILLGGVTRLTVAASLLLEGR